MAGGRKKSRDELSTKPINVRARIRRKNRDMNADIEVLEAVGYKPIEEWSLEELARGKPRINGKFRAGPPPAWLTPKIAAEAKRRLQDVTLSELSVHVGRAIQVVSGLLDNDDMTDEGYPIVDPKLKHDAAKFIIEHVIGKPKQRTEIDIGDTLAEMMAGSLLNPDGTPAHPVAEVEDIVDADLVEDDDE